MYDEKSFLERRKAWIALAVVLIGLEIFTRMFPCVHR
jgi:hypothetical protein